MPNNPKNTRKCIVCHEHASKDELIRIVRNENGIIVDSDKKLPGRGCYVHKNTECLTKLKKKRMLNNAYKCNVGDSVYEDIVNDN